MVYPRRDGSRSLAKFIALCAVTSCLFQGGVDAKAHKKQAPSAPAAVVATAPIAAAAGPCTADAGDLEAGVQVINDASCAKGGLGCYNDHCRHCKFKETALSAHLNGCDVYGLAVVSPATAPASGTYPAAPTSTSATPAAPAAPVAAVPNVETGCSYDVSPGDYSLGIQLVGDATCARGGVGCFQDVCRYCKFHETAQSSHLVGCDSLGYNFGSSVINPADIGGGEVPTITTTPVVTAAPPAAGPVVVDTGCPYAVSEGDSAVGIQLVGDATCVSGGVGCFADVCRFCQYRTTPQSGHLIACKDLGVDFGGAGQPAATPVPGATTAPAPEPATTPAHASTSAPAPATPPVDSATGCPYPISEGDYAVGIQLVGDATCASGGLGCFKDACRFCKYKESPQSAHLPSCGDFGYPRTSAPTFAPVDITEPPVVEPPVVDPSTGCAYPVTEGDYKVGIQLVGDATCASGGLGCFKDVCRYCQYRKTAQSGHFMSCKDLGYDFAAGSDAYEPETDAPVTSDPVVPGDDGSASGTSTCPLSVSEGDLASGIQLVSDVSCAKGGLGCVADVCRFCKFRDTPQSAHLIDCAAFSNAAPAPSDGIPISQPSDVNNGECPFTASEGDLNIGVQIIADATCDIGGVGCFHDACRFCKFFDTDKSAHLEDCSKFGFNFEPIATTAPPRPGDTLAPVPPTLPPPVVPTGECTQSVSEGDKKAGIDMVTDASCLVGGVGCLPDSVCRHCKLVQTAANGHMEWCSKITGVAVDTPAPVSDATAPPASDATASPATATPGASSWAQCDQTVSEGDKAAGIDLITDAACVDGGIGCLPKSTCRYCKRAQSAASAHFQWCPGSSDAMVDEPVATVAPGAPVDAPVVTAGPAPAGPAVDASAPCDQIVSAGDAAEGIALATDPACVNGGTGCLPKSTCRHCKRWVTAASSHLEWCGGYDGYLPPSTTPVTVVDPIEPSAPSPTLAAEACSTEVAPGDAEAGVAAVHDKECLNGGIGCFGGVCRFCQVFASDKSANFLPCETMVRTIAPLRAAAKVRTASTSTKDELDELFKDAAFKWSVVGAACVGVVAVVALFGLGAKRAVTRARKFSAEEASTEEETETDVATVTAATSSDSEETSADEVHV